eukprot:TRINITY_DN1183_c0_g1_i1.p1 TRINITY_DN1183_c0_g1~~TRINITY_DN1183_c0_g1_i1.p1  ORF type:complete len:471 (+),score=68.43 TRINITY_DN1183_c0_g1_i1:149-1561(+)
MLARRYNYSPHNKRSKIPTKYIYKVRQPPTTPTQDLNSENSDPTSPSLSPVTNLSRDSRNVVSTQVQNSPRRSQVHYGYAAGSPSSPSNQTYAYYHYKPQPMTLSYPYAYSTVSGYPLSSPMYQSQYFSQYYHQPTTNPVDNQSTFEDHWNESPPPRRNLMKVHGIGEMTIEEFRDLFCSFQILKCFITEKEIQLGLIQHTGVVNFGTVKDLYRAFQMRHKETIVLHRNDGNGKNITISIKLICKINESTLDPLFCLTKPQILSLPMIQYRGKTILVDSIWKVDPALDSLFDKPIEVITERDNVLLGIDIEWKPTKRIGEYNPTALLQLATQNTCVLFRVNLLKEEHYANSAKEYNLPAKLVNILSNPHIHKVGCGITRDAKKLKKDFDVEVVGTYDIEDLPLTKRCKPKHLSALTAIFLGYHMSKLERMTNWEQPHLTSDQIIYAATDAWCGREVYIKMTQVPYSLVYS